MYHYKILNITYSTYIKRLKQQGEDCNQSGQDQADRSGARAVAGATI
jgi:hypothetical protein